MRRRHQGPRAGQGERSAEEGNNVSTPAANASSCQPLKQMPVATPSRARIQCTPQLRSPRARHVEPEPPQPINFDPGPQQPTHIEPRPHQPIETDPRPQQPIETDRGPQQPTNIELGPHQPLDIESGPQQPVDIEPGPQQQPIEYGEHRCQFEEIGDDVVVTAGDGRVACSNCFRWFSPDRVAVHQGICLRVNTEEKKSGRRNRIKGVGSNVRSTTQQRQRPSRSFASGYRPGRRRKTQEELLPGGVVHNRMYRVIDTTSDRRVCD